jgi:ribosomal protein L7/L12
MDVAVTALAVLFVVLAAWESKIRLARSRRSGADHVPAEQVRADVLAVAAGGADKDRIRAIKALRERTGLGLLDAKRTVDRWLDEEPGTPQP